MSYTVPDIETVLQNLDGQIKNISISRLTAPGENLSCLVFKMDVDLLKNGSKETISTVLKRLPVNEADMRMNAVPMRNELRWYTEILPFIRSFAQDNGIDSSFYPEYIGSRFSLDKTKREVDSEAVLVLENLIPQGYIMEDRHVGFDLTTAKSLLRALATFHAIPLVIKFKRPDLFEKLAEFLRTASPPEMANKDPKAGPGGPEKRQGPYENLLNKPELSQYRDTLIQINTNSKGIHWFDHNGKEPWLTVGHNDFWVNNMMVKKVEKGEPLVKLIDFQFGTYISFAKDLVFFLLTSVIDSVQREHFDDLLRYYYNEFTAVLKKANAPELDLSYEDYIKEVKRVAEEGEIKHALIFTGIIFGRKDVKLDFLAGEGSRMEHLKSLSQSVSPRQLEKVLCIMELVTKQGWI